MGKQWKTLFFGAPKSLQMVIAAMKLKGTCSLEGKLWKPSQHIKQQRHHFADKGPSSQSYGFSSNHVWMWELEHKEGWVLKNWCFWIVVLEKHLECPLQRDQITSILKEINPEYSLEVLLLKLKLHYFGHIGGFLRGTTRISGSLSCGAREVRASWVQQRERVIALESW